MVSVIFYLCLTALFGYYMYLCNENKVGMFKDRKHEERIADLERKVKALEGR